MKVAKVTSSARGQSSSSIKSAIDRTRRTTKPSGTTQSPPTAASANCSSSVTSCTNAASAKVKRNARSDRKHNRPIQTRTEPSCRPDSDSSDVVVGAQSHSPVIMGKTAIDAVALRKAICALCRHVQKVHQRRHEQNEATDLLADSRGPTLCLMFSLEKIPDRPCLIPRSM